MTRRANRPSCADSAREFIQRDAVDVAVADVRTRRYMVFIYFWSSEFIIALGQIILALAVSTWYFTRDKGKIGNSTVVWSFRQGAFYHWGTAAFGSLIIAIIKTIRAMIKYVQKKCKNLKNPVAKKIAMAVLCCIDCCMWCA